jgi:hypothetical protein
LIAITGVQSVKISGGADFIRRSGDADRFPTTIINHFNEPSMAISADDHLALLTITPGSRGTVTATHKDAKLATSGNIVYSLANATPGSPDLGGGHKQISEASIMFWGESSDGTTSPLSYTLV